MDAGFWFPGRQTVRGQALGLLLLLTACTTRDRIGVPGPTGPSGGAGPTTTIDVPGTDTTVTAGPNFVVAGRTIDPDGVDTVYFETEGGLTTFPPFTGGNDTVRFGLPLTTGGLVGDSILVRVFGTDRLGNRGDTATRWIRVQ